MSNLSKKTAALGGRTKLAFSASYQLMLSSQKVLVLTAVGDNPVNGAGAASVSKGMEVAGWVMAGVGRTAA